jgi:hypothetical protein
LAAFLVEPVFQHLPAVSGALVIRLIREHLNDVHNRGEPHFGLLIVDTADFVSLKNGQFFFHNGVLIFFDALRYSEQWSLKQQKGEGLFALD